MLQTAKGWNSNDFDVSQERDAKEAPTNCEHTYQRNDTEGGESEWEFERAMMVPNLVISPVVMLYRMRVEMRDSDLNVFVSWQTAVEARHLTLRVQCGSC